MVFPVLVGPKILIILGIAGSRRAIVVGAEPASSIIMRVESVSLAGVLTAVLHSIAGSPVVHPPHEGLGVHPDILLGVHVGMTSLDWLDVVDSVLPGPPGSLLTSGHPGLHFNMHGG